MFTSFEVLTILSKQNTFTVINNVTTHAHRILVAKSTMKQVPYSNSSEESKLSSLFHVFSHNMLQLYHSKSVELKWILYRMFAEYFMLRLNRNIM